MNTIERYRLNRYDSIARILIQNRAVVANSRELSYSSSKFCKVLEVIKKKQKEFNSQFHSRQLRTLKIKDELILIVSSLAGAIYAFGKKIENPELKNASRLTQRELFAMADSRLIQKAMDIYHFSEKYCRELKEYNITKGSIQFLKSKTEEFKEALIENSPRYCFLNHSVIKLDNLFMQADAILKNIDGFVEVLSGSYSKFSSEYLSIRYTKKNQMLSTGTNPETR